MWRNTPSPARREEGVLAEGAEKFGLDLVVKFRVHKESSEEFHPPFETG